VFGQIVAVSGYFHTDDETGMFGGVPSVLAANTPDAMVAAAAGRRVQLIESTAESDPLIRGQASYFAARLRACRCAGAVDLRLDRGDHDLGFVASEIPVIAAFLDAGWVVPRRRPAAVSRDGALVRPPDFQAAAGCPCAG
jgi:hypothetical protein